MDERKTIQNQIPKQKDYAGFERRKGISFELMPRQAKTLSGLSCQRRIAVELLNPGSKTNCVM